jgi:hypothetical protein
MDSDDIAHEGRIAVQVGWLERHQEVGLVATHARLVYDDGRERLFTPPTDDASLRRYLLWDNPFVHSAVMYRKQAFLGAKGYTPGPVANEDYRLWIEMARFWKLAVVPEVLVTYRVRSDSASRAADRQLALRARLAAQWRAAHVLGPWHQAVPALTATGAACLLHRIARPVEASIRSRGFGPHGRWSRRR